MVTCGCCGPGSAQTQLSPSWSRVHPRLPVSRLAAGTSQGFMAPSSVGIGCAWHTLRLLTEVSPSFPLSQFRFLQPLLFRCIPTPFPAPFIPQESDGHPALGLCIPWAMKDPLGQNQSPSPCVPGRQGPGWQELSQAPLPSQWDLGHKRHPKQGVRPPAGEQVVAPWTPGMLVRALSSHSQPSAPQGYRRIFHHSRTQ